MHQAQHTGQTIVVADPACIRAYHPDGSVDIYYSADGTYVRSVASGTPPCDLYVNNGANW